MFKYEQHVMINKQHVFIKWAIAIPLALVIARGFRTW